MCTHLQSAFALYVDSHDPYLKKKVMRHTLYQTQFCVRKLRHGEDKLLAKATHLINGTHTRACIAAVCFLKGNYLLDLSISPLTRRKMDRYRNCEFSAGEY